jgi:hypothetical protein
MILKLKALPGLIRLAKTRFDALVPATLVLAAVRVVLRIAYPDSGNRSPPSSPEGVLNSSKT